MAYNLSGLPTTALQPGNTGAAVQQLQQWLVSNGFLSQAAYNTGPGTYGPATTAAVNALQQKLGVNNSSGPGYFGPATLNALQTQAAAPAAQAPASNPNVLSLSPSQASSIGVPAAAAPAQANPANTLSLPAVPITSSNPNVLTLPSTPSASGNVMTSSPSNTLSSPSVSSAASQASTPTQPQQSINLNPVGGNGSEVAPTAIPLSQFKGYNLPSNGYFSYNGQEYEVNDGYVIPTNSMPIASVPDISKYAASTATSSGSQTSTSNPNVGTPGSYYYDQSTGNLYSAGGSLMASGNLQSLINSGNFSGSISQVTTTSQLPFSTSSSANNSSSSTSASTGISGGLIGVATNLSQSGYAIPADLQVTPALVSQFLSYAHQAVDPYTQQQISGELTNINANLSAMSTNYQNQQAETEQQFGTDLANEQNSAGGAGTAFSGQRNVNELNMAASANRTLANNAATTAYNIGSAARATASDVGSANAGGIVLPTLAGGSVSLSGGQRGSSGAGPNLSYNYDPSIYTSGTIQQNAATNVSNAYQSYMNTYGQLAGSQTGTGRSVSDLIGMIPSITSLPGYSTPTNLN